MKEIIDFLKKKELMGFERFTSESFNFLRTKETLNESPFFQEAEIIFIESPWIEDDNKEILSAKTYLLTEDVRFKGKLYITNMFLSPKQLNEDNQEIRNVCIYCISESMSIKEKQNFNFSTAKQLKSYVTIMYLNRFEENNEMFIKPEVAFIPQKYEEKFLLALSERNRYTLTKEDIELFCKNNNIVPKFGF